MQATCIKERSSGCKLASHRSCTVVGALAEFVVPRSLRGDSGRPADEVCHAQLRNQLASSPRKWPRAVIFIRQGKLSKGRKRSRPSITSRSRATRIGTRPGQPPLLESVKRQPVPLDDWIHTSVPQSSPVRKPVTILQRYPEMVKSLLCTGIWACETSGRVSQSDEGAQGSSVTHRTYIFHVPCRIIVGQPKNMISVLRKESSAAAYPGQFGTERFTTQSEKHAEETIDQALGY